MSEPKILTEAEVSTFAHTIAFMAANRELLSPEERGLVLDFARVCASHEMLRRLVAQPPPQVEVQHPDASLLESAYDMGSSDSIDVIASGQSRGGFSMERLYAYIAIPEPQSRG